MGDTSRDDRQVAIEMIRRAARDIDSQFSREEVITLLNRIDTLEDALTEANARVLQGIYQHIPAGQNPEDGVVAAILLQTWNSDAPGDAPGGE